VTASNAPPALAARLRDAGLDWIVPDWRVPAHVHAFATTRAGGASAGSYATMNLARNSRDDPAALAENQRRFECFLPAGPAKLDQVHGVAVATLKHGGSSTPVIADAAVTRERGVVCAILTADCLPVLFADRSGTAVGIAHAGWRGLAAGVLEATVGALRELGADAGELTAWLGPAIGPAAFEVGEDVFAAFCTRDAAAAACFAPHRPGKWHADLYRLARQRLARRGLTRVHGGGHCTFTDQARFFSFRRERESGRMATAIWLDDN
jgi:YfiH family protein